MRPGAGTAVRAASAGDAFAGSRACFEELLGWLEGTEAAMLTHAELEEQVDTRGRELLRQLYQAHLDLRAVSERPRTVTDADGIGHAAVETGHSRGLSTLFGPVRVTRLAYRHRGHANLYAADALLNLPVERYSHGIRRLSAIEAARGSFEDAAAAIGRRSGTTIGKRQVESLTARAAVDIGDYYATRTAPPAADDDLLVLSADGKGIVMRPDSLRPATAARAAAATAKLKTRLTRGEKRNRKRIAEVGAVYDLAPNPRTAADVMTPSHDSDQHPADPPPRAKGKWVTASVVDDAAHVLKDVFDEAERRDPTHRRTWIALVDGNNHQIDRVKAEAAARGIQVTILIDFIHVLEYLWRAAWCFHTEADPAAEAWVRNRAQSILDGHANEVAAGLRRRASNQRLPPPKRAKVDQAANYLNNKADHLDYPTALTKGWPIATGVIEGTCRHLVADRMDITGARWSAQGAEAVLKLRTITTNGDFNTYWHYHLEREHQRNHQTRYLNNAPPTAA